MQPAFPGWTVERRWAGWENSSDARSPTGNSADILLVHYCPSEIVHLLRKIPGYPLVGVTQKCPIPEEQNALRNLSTGFPVGLLGDLSGFFLIDQVLNGGRVAVSHGGGFIQRGLSFRETSDFGIGNGDVGVGHW